MSKIGGKGRKFLWKCIKTILVPRKRFEMKDFRFKIENAFSIYSNFITQFKVLGTEVPLSGDLGGLFIGWCLHQPKL